MKFVWHKQPADDVVTRDIGEPLEGTNMSLFQSQIPNWWDQNINTSPFFFGIPQLADRVWVANRAQQLNSQQISAMPLVFHGPDGSMPKWLTSPDPTWYPNGVGDAVFSIVDQIYRYGFACLYITDRYADGWARTWTVLSSCDVTVDLVDGARGYKIGADRIDPERVVQIDRNPGVHLHGTPALHAYAQAAWGLLAAQNQSMTVSSGGIPKFYLSSERKLNKEQAEALQLQWMTASGSRNGAPPVLPPEIKPTEMSFDPASMALLDTQEWNARTIATAYGIPSVILNMALQGGLTYQNPIALMQMWWLTELRTTAKRIGDAFSSQLLPLGQYVSFDASDITTDAAPNSANDEQASENQSQVVTNAPPATPGRLSAVTG